MASLIIVIGLALFIVGCCVLASDYDEELEEFIKEEMEGIYESKRH